jgi:argininosuccinate lyase
MKGLPLAYNKDMQEDKEGVFDSVENVQISLEILNKAMETLTINSDKMGQATKVGHLSATDLADYLVQKCEIPFREAHFITGKAVAKSEELNIDLSEISLEELQKIDSRIESNVIDFLNLKNSMNARNSFGGTSTEQTKNQIKIIESWLKDVS